MVRRHLEAREPTILGHMNARRSGTQTTKKKATKKAGEEKNGMHPRRRKKIIRKTCPRHPTEPKATSRDTPSIIR